MRRALRAFLRNAIFAGVIFGLIDGLEDSSLSAGLSGAVSGGVFLGGITTWFELHKKRTSLDSLLAEDRERVKSAVDAGRSIGDSRLSPAVEQYAGEVRAATADPTGMWVTGAIWLAFAIIAAVGAATANHSTTITIDAVGAVAFFAMAVLGPIERRRKQAKANQAAAAARELRQGSAAT